MRRQVGAVVSILVLLAALAATAPGSAVPPVPAEVGEWSAPFAENALYAQRPPQTVAESLETPTAVSAVVLPDGRVLYWNGATGLEDSAGPLALDAGRSGRKSQSRILDLSGATPLWSTPKPDETGGTTDLFCADQRLLYDGRVVAAGGTIWKSDPVDLTPVTGPEGPGGTAELFGSKETRLFNHLTDTWSPAQDMHAGRWYPTLVTLPNGTLFVASGVERLVYNDKGTNVHKVEVFDPTAGTWADKGAEAETTLPLFARMHLMPDGKVFYDGTGQMWSPAGQAYDEALWNLHKAYDPVANSWKETGVGAFGSRSGAISVMLRLEPPYDEAEILVAGGTLGTSPGSYLANNLTEVITYDAGEEDLLQQSTSERKADLNNRRWYSSGVLLPDGGVLVVSGGDADEVIDPGSEKPVRQAELFDGSRWIPLSSGGRDRTYHNSAVLLADGSVLVGGHAPINAHYGPKGDPANDDNGLANNLKDPSFEIFEPPYLFRGNRPTISGVQKGIAWNSTFPVLTPDAASVDEAVLVRLPSATHITDADMRALKVSFSREAGVLLASAPSDGKVAPPGWYYLFLLRDNGDGLTPSKARIVRVGPAADLAPAAAPMGA